MNINKKKLHHGFKTFHDRAFYDTISRL